MLAYIGTQTGGASRGIYELELDPATGSLSTPRLAAATENPTFLALAPGGRVLYAAGGPTRASEADPGGFVCGFSLEAASGSLSPLNRMGAGSGRTTHVAVDSTGRMVLAADYHGGAVCAYTVGPDGALAARSALLRTTGPLGPNRARQDRPHPHSVTVSPGNGFAIVCDLGLDRVLLFRIDPASGSLEPHSTPWVVFPPGSGPRHSVFSGDGRFLYVANELDSSVCALAWDESAGALGFLQKISTLPAGFRGESIVAEIRIHPSGRHLYVSNRGHDSVATFSRDPSTGALAPAGFTPSGGGHPRNFALSPDGRWLLCANRDSGNVVSFRVAEGTGALDPAGFQAKVPEPVCVLFRG